MSDDLVKRARDCANGIGSFKSNKGDFGLLDDLADRIAALTAERDALAEQVKRARDDALEEAAKIAENKVLSSKEAAKRIRALRGATEGEGGMRYTLESTGHKDSKRIVNDAGFVVGTVEQYSNGTWAVHDSSGRQLSRPEHTTPRKALKAWLAPTGDT